MWSGGYSKLGDIRVRGFFKFILIFFILVTGVSIPVWGGSYGCKQLGHRAIYSVSDVKANISFCLCDSRGSGSGVCVHSAASYGGVMHTALEGAGVFHFYFTFILVSGVSIPVWGGIMGVSNWVTG